MQEFENNTELSSHIERMACTGETGNTLQWSDFLGELNSELRKTAELERLLNDCREILATNNWRGDLQDEISEMLDT